MQDLQQTKAISSQWLSLAVNLQQFFETFSFFLICKYFYDFIGRNEQYIIALMGCWMNVQLVDGRKDGRTSGQNFLAGNTRNSRFVNRTGGHRVGERGSGEQVIGWRADRKVEYWMCAWVVRRT